MKGIVIQVSSAIILSIGNFLLGYSIAWPSYTLEVYKNEHSPIGKITSTDSSLIGSLPMLGLLAAVLVTGMLSDKIGRKKAELLSGLCFVLCWSIITTAKNVKMILAGRFLIGFAAGMHFVVVLPFVSEISQASIRGTLASLLTFSYTFGILISYVTGWLCSYDVINYLNLTLSVVSVVLMCFLKDSPTWLLGQGREKDALKSLKFYRGVSKTTLDVLNEIKYLKSQRETNAVEYSKLDGEKQNLEKQKIVEPDVSAWKILCTSKAAQRALVTVTIHVILLVFGGMIAVQTYAAQLFTAAAPNMSADACSVLLAISFVVGSALSLLLCDLLGRRPLMISSCMMCGLCLATLASLLRWSWGPEWMIPAAVLMFSCIFHIGVANIPFIQLSECFVPKMKGLASTIVLSMMCISNFIVLAVFPMAVETVGLDGAFFVFAMECGVTALVAALLMQETKGAPIEDILRMYERGYLYRRLDK